MMISLKQRYAFFVLTTLLLLICTGWFTAVLFQSGNYLAAVSLLILLYGVTFVLGKKFAYIYFLLSAVKHLRRHGGLLTRASFNSFIIHSFSRRKTVAEATHYAEEILDLLISEEIVEIVDDQVVLVDVSSC